VPLASFYWRNGAKAREFRRLAAECVDLVPALTARLAAVPTVRDIGLPEERWAEVNRVVERRLLSAPHDPDAARDAGQEVCLLIVEQMEARRGGADGTVLSSLLEATIDGQPLPDEAIISMMYLLLLGIQPTLDVRRGEPRPERAGRGTGVVGRARRWPGAYLRDMGGTPADVLDNPDLLALMLPTLRADLTVVATWPYRRRPRPPVPIHAFTGADAPSASPALMASWRHETDDRFEQTVLPGGHFFVTTELPALASAIVDGLVPAPV
jgi:hypothetical protein